MTPLAHRCPGSRPPPSCAAPLTAGNFLANVLDGVYTGASLSSTYNAVLVGDQVGGRGRRVLQWGRKTGVARFCLPCGYGLIL